MKLAWAVIAGVLCLANGQWQHSRGVGEGARLGVDLAIEILKAVPTKDDIDWAPEYDQRRAI